MERVYNMATRGQHGSKPSARRQGTMTTTGGSTSTKSPAPSAAPTVRPRRRLSTAEYRRIIEEGILRPGDRVELIEGEMLLMPPTSNDHTWGVTRLNRLFMRHEAGNFVLQTQSTIHLAEGFSPDPDFILLQPREDDYRHPPATARHTPRPGRTPAPCHSPDPPPAPAPPRQPRPRAAD